MTDFIYQRPRLTRRLEGERRGRWLATHLDRFPKEVIAQSGRSLCLVKPTRIWASFSLDAFSGKYQARMGLSLSGVEHVEAGAPRGVPVTDVNGVHWGAPGSARRAATWPWRKTSCKRSWASKRFTSRSA